MTQLLVLYTVIKDMQKIELKDITNKESDSPNTATLLKQHKLIPLLKYQGGFQ
jgi:hypothetical protein